MQLIRIKEAAAILGVDVRKVYRLMERRRIPYYFIDGSRRLAKEEVEAYLESCRVAPIASSSIRQRSIVQTPEVDMPPMPRALRESIERGVPYVKQEL